MLCPVSAPAGLQFDQHAISRQLQRWADAFNRRDLKGVCSIFADGLVATTPNALAASRDEVCDRLASLLSKPNLQPHYSVSIQEVMVSGDLAVVRLVWTLQVTDEGRRETTLEAGIDIFERQADGRWLITRFVSFPADATP